METTALDSSLSTLNIALNFAIGAVVIGLVLEYAPEFWSKLSRRSHKWIEKSGEILVILGVAGELLLHVRSEQIDDQIKSLQRAGLAQLFDRATAAEKAAAEAKLALAKMTTPRIIDAPKESVLIQKLKSQAGNRFWIITQTSGTGPFGSSEQDIFGQQLSGIFLAANWKKDSRTTNDVSKADPETNAVGDRGCFISASTVDPGPALRLLVVTGLTEAGIDCRWNANSDLAKDMIVIEIGLE